MSNEIIKNTDVFEYLDTQLLVAEEFSKSMHLKSLTCCLQLARDILKSQTLGDFIQSSSLDKNPQQKNKRS